MLIGRQNVRAMKPDTMRRRRFDEEEVGFNSEIARPAGSGDAARGAYRGAGRFWRKVAGPGCRAAACI